MVAAATARLPPRFLGGQIGRAGVPVIKLGRRHRGCEPGHPCGVGEEMAHEGLFLALLAVLRPVLDHGRVQIQLSLIGKHQGGEKRHGLGGGKDVDDGVLGPGTRFRRIRVPGPEIHHVLTVDRRGEARPHVPTFAEVGLESLADRRKSRIAEPVNLHALSPCKKSQFRARGACPSTPRRPRYSGRCPSPPRRPEAGGLVGSCPTCRTPPPSPGSCARPACRTHFRKVSAVHPIFPAIEPIAAHCSHGRRTTTGALRLTTRARAAPS